MKLIPKRNERSELVHFRMSAGKAWFHTPRLCRGTGSRLSDSGSRALPRGMIPFILLALIFIPALSAGADEADLVRFRNLLERSSFPENDETRRLLSDTVTAPAYPAVETLFKINRQLSDGRLVQFEVRKAVRDWYLIFRNQRGNEPRETYPLWGRGTWIIKKDLLTGSYIQAKIFLQDDENSFVRIFPMKDNRSRLDVHLYGRQLDDDVIIPVSFEELMLTPFARIAALTEHSVDWDMIFPDPDSYGYRNVEQLVNALAYYEESIEEVGDAAVNGAGLNVFIESGDLVLIGEATSGGGILEKGQTGLNCSGYVKWVADGLYSAWSGTPGSRHLDIDVLRQTTSRSNRNPWNESRSASGDDAREDMEALLRDPQFGLDWNRNLAWIVEETRLGRNLSADEKDALDTGKLIGIPYRRDLGYNLDDLASALYQLAAASPGAVYLAAVNSRFLPEPTESDPDPIPLHQYWHVSILAPWFDSGKNGTERGQFRVAVLDVGDVSESLLRDPRLIGEPRFPANIMSNATRYARLGRDDSGNALIPEVMFHLIRMDVPSDVQPSPLPEAR